MKNIDLYKEVVVAVKNETGVEEYEMLHSNSEEAVDARYILIHLLSQKLTDTQISSLTRLTSQQDTQQFSVQDKEMECSNELATY